MNEEEKKTAKEADATVSPAAISPDNPGAAAERDDQESPPKLIKAKPLTITIMALVALAGVLTILYAWQLWPFQSALVTTENAYVRGKVTTLAPQVNGYVVAVAATDFQQVNAGDVLVRIDDRIYRQRVAQAEGELAARRFDLENLAQTLASDKAEIVSRKADLASAQAEAARSRTDQERVDELASRRSVSVRERDQTRSTARSAEANVDKARAAINIAEQMLKRDQVSRGGLEAQIQIAQANLRLAQIDLENTVIRAPESGQLSAVSVRVGQYVSAGSQLLYLVPPELWVVANYKETQTVDMRIGQAVTFSVDSLDHAVLRGRIERFSPATGSEFSVLRPDNASGNFTKVVQRIPVRISVDPDQPLLFRLRPGMSVIPRVDTASVAREDTP